MTISKSPVMMLFRELLLPPEPKIKSEAPTTLSPMMTVSIPSHSRPFKRRPRKAVDSNPVKIITAPAKRKYVGDPKLLFLRKLLDYLSASGMKMHMSD